MVRSRRRLTRRTIRVDVFALLILTTCSAVSGCSVRRPAARQLRAEDVRVQMEIVLTLGLRSYDSLYDGLPPVTIPDKYGAPSMSWRGPVYGLARTASIDRSFEPEVSFDKAWFAAENRLAVATACSFYCFDRDEHGRPKTSPNIFAITGSGTAFDESQVTRLSAIPHDTILLIESRGTAVTWLEPGDINVTDLSRYRQAVSHPRGQHVGFADGTVWCISVDTPTVELQKLCTIDGAMEFDRDVVLERHRIRER